MEILILSDSHGRTDRLLEIMKRCEKYPLDKILFLGDGENDIKAIERKYSIPVLAVAGNCDIMSEDPYERIVGADGKRILMLHGHTRGVKHGLERLEYRAKELGANIVLYGHTHEAYSHSFNGVFYFNPGSVGFPSHGAPSFGRLTIIGDIVSFSHGEL